METLQAIARRKSTRSFAPERQLEPADITTIVAAGCAAPVGGADYQSLHLTVITGRAALTSVVQAAQKAMHMDANPLYGATALVVISAAAEQKAPNIELANAGCIAENMMLAATDLGIDSVYIWGVIAATAADTELWKGMGIPAGYRPVSSVALGYGAETGATDRELSITLSVNYV